MLKNVKSKETNFLPADRQLIKQIASLKDFIVGDNALGVDYDLIMNEKKIKLCYE